MKCPVCGETRNMAKVLYRENGKEHENVLCLNCKKRSLIFHIRHLVLRSGNFALKFKRQTALINGNALTIGEEVIITKINEKYVATIFGESIILNGFKNPPAPLSLLR